MNYVEPIRDVNKIREIYEHFRKTDKTGRNAMIFKVGINSNLRASDLTSLKVSDFEKSMQLKVKENKTGKTKMMVFNPTVIKSIQDYIKRHNLKDDDYLFFNLRKVKGKSCIDRVDLWKIMQSVKKIAGIEHIGTHSLRKTFGWHYYKTYKDLALLMIILNHSSEAETLRYIGVTEMQIRNAYEKMGELYGI